MFREAIRVVRVVLLFAGLGIAQTAPAPKAAPTTKDAGSVPASNPGQPSDETVDAFLHQMFGFDTSVSWTVQSIRPAQAQGLTEVVVLVTTPQGPQRTAFFVTADGSHMVAGDLLPFGAKPFAVARERLEKGITGPVRGPANAPVTIVEFSDLQCPHCKESHPTIEKLLGDETNVRFVFQNFPLPSHDWAAKAAAYADCVGRASNDAFWKFIHNTYEAQAEITETNADEKLTAIADGAGVKGADMASCAANPETTDHVEKSIDLGRAMEVDATPTMFINGRRVMNFASMPYENLKKMVEFYGKLDK